MAWEWQVWRCFDNIRETFEVKGWEYRFDGRDDKGVVLLLAESGDQCMVFFGSGPDTGECWFELRDKTHHRMLFVQGTRNIPTPERAAKLLDGYGTFLVLGEVRAPHELLLYSLPVAPVGPVAEAGLMDGPELLDAPNTITN